MGIAKKQVLACYTSIPLSATTAPTNDEKNHSKLKGVPKPVWYFDNVNNVILSSVNNFNFLKLQKLEST